MNATLTYETKVPVLLLRKHHFTELVILNCHETVKHNRIRETLTELRILECQITQMIQPFQKSV